MKKALSILLSVLLIASLAGCAAETPPPSGDDDAAAPVEIIVFAAASMKETITEIVELYKDVAPNVTVTATFESSGTLKTQIEEGALCDIFISAAQRQMNQLDITKDEAVNPDRLDFVMEGTRINLLENKVALVVPEGNEGNITSFADIAGCRLIAIGNSDVPVGSYSLEIFDFIGLDVAAMEAAGQITYGGNVKEVTTQVAEATCDCGIVYATDAFSAGLEVVDTATLEMCAQVIYPAALIKDSTAPEAAQAFLNYLGSADAIAVFEAVGFSYVG